MEFELSYLLKILACFGLGAIPFAKVAMWGTGIDITKVGSRNPGFNNVLRVSTKPRAAIALAGDISKGYIALLLLGAGVMPTRSMAASSVSNQASLAASITAPLRTGSTQANSEGSPEYLI